MPHSDELPIAESPEITSRLREAAKCMGFRINQSIYKLKINERNKGMGIQLTSVSYILWDIATFCSIQKQ